eukprot:5481905-Pyramimonas_sp.AAC.1
MLQRAVTVILSKIRMQFCVPRTAAAGNATCMVWGLPKCVSRLACAGCCFYCVYLFVCLFGGMALLVQNAETVRMVAPKDKRETQSAQTNDHGRATDWTTISVNDLKAGDVVLVHQQAAARHTGIEVVEKIVEQ